MKKTTSIFGALSAVMILLCSANTFAVSPAKSITGQEWGMQINPTTQKMSVTGSTPANVRIVGSKGNVMYTGKVNGSTNSIDISSMEEGKYKVYLQNGNVTEEYKMEIL